MSARGFIVAGTDTGIGKTVFAAALTGALDADYWKPVQSGLDDATDSETVAALAGLRGGQIFPEVYRLRQPLSPHLAAERDGVTIDPARLVLPKRDLPDRPLVVELAGGLLVPITRGTLQVDVAALWGLPVVLVARTALGTINHSLLSLEALNRRGVPVHGLAFVGPANVDSEATIAAMGNVRRLGRLDPVDPLTADRLKDAFAAGFDVEDFL